MYARGIPIYGIPLAFYACPNIFLLEIKAMPNVMPNVITQGNVRIRADRLNENFMRINAYGECSTAAATAAKTVTVGASNFSLITGAEIIVKFTITNTAENPTLSVNSTTAKAIYYKGSPINKDVLTAGAVYKLVYDGTYWQVIGDIVDNEFTALSTADIDELFAEESESA